MCVSIENYNPTELTNTCFVRNTIMWETKSRGIMKMSHQAQFKAYLHENMTKTRENSTESIPKYPKCKTQKDFEFLVQ